MKVVLHTYIFPKDAKEKHRVARTVKSVGGQYSARGEAILSLMCNC